jgi:hypothetical protein
VFSVGGVIESECTLANTFTIDQFFVCLVFWWGGEHVKKQKLLFIEQKFLRNCHFLEPTSLFEMISRKMGSDACAEHSP